MTSTEEVVSTILATVDQVITRDDRDALIECLNQQIEQVQLRYTLLSAMRDSLLPELTIDLGRAAIALTSSKPASSSTCGVTVRPRPRT